MTEVSPARLVPGPRFRTERHLHQRYEPSVRSRPTVGPRAFPSCPRALCPLHFWIEPLATLKLHYDGWLTLPAGLRQMLDLKTGDRLQADLVDGTIVLRPVHGKRTPAEPEQAIEPPAVTSAPAPSLETALPQKRPRGRPRKVPASEHPSHLMLGIAGDSLPSPKRKPGRPRKVPLEAAEPGPSSMVGEGTLWKLRPKAELTAKAPDPAPPPPRRPEPSRIGGSREREERRPFTNVEIRKLGAGRGHNRLQRV